MARTIKPTNGTAPARDNGNARARKSRDPEEERKQRLERRARLLAAGLHRLGLSKDGRPELSRDPETGRILPGPRYTFDPSQIETLARKGASQKTIAELLGFSDNTLKERPEYYDAWKRGAAQLDMAVGLRQVELVMQDDDLRTAAIQAIWLGKNRLGQTDRLDQRAMSFHQHVHTIDEKVLRAMAASSRSQDVNRLLIDIGAINALPPMRDNEELQPQAQCNPNDATEATVITSRALPLSRIETSELTNAE